MKAFDLWMEKVKNIYDHSYKQFQVTNKLELLFFL